MRATLLFAVALVLPLPTSSSAFPGISRRLVVALAPEDRARAGAPGAARAASGSAALAGRFECLGLTVERTPPHGLPLQRSPRSRARPRPLHIHPQPGWLATP